MWINKIDEINYELLISIPLTKGTEKTRIKKRSFFNEYGIPVPTKTEPFSLSCYVEWQIGYDVATDDAGKMERTSIKNKLFIGANGKKKTLYELSEYIYYFYNWEIIKEQDLLGIKGYLSGLSQNDYLDCNRELAIERSHPISKNILGIDFSFTQLKYPLLIHKFGQYEILTEIIIKEKQYAIGVQPMLYFCFPITELKSSKELIGRTAETKEMADFVIDKNNIQIFLEILKIFGILSINHNKDIISIIDIILTK
ncbi:MAG: R.Pab1 family restriction endonuclease [Ignavibacteria bacterium]|jgi:hypothetical protein|nr:R.Pab1 family restriction endonuclease [Ignavibacteria bacterium]